MVYEYYKLFPFVIIINCWSMTPQHIEQPKTAGVQSFLKTMSTSSDESFQELIDPGLRVNEVSIVSP